MRDLIRVTNEAARELEEPGSVLDILDWLREEHPERLEEINPAQLLAAIADESVTALVAAVRGSWAPDPMVTGVWGYMPIGWPPNRAGLVLYSRELDFEISGELELAAQLAKAEEGGA